LVYIFCQKLALAWNPISYKVMLKSRMSMTKKRSPNSESSPSRLRAEALLGDNPAEAEAANKTIA